MRVRVPPSELGEVVGESLTVGGAVEYVDFGDARINNPTTLKGDYDTNRAVFMALTLNWKF